MIEALKSGGVGDSMAEPSRGAIYLAFGKPYLLQALYSFSTLRRHNPDLPVIILTNVSVDIREPGLHIYYLQEPDSNNRFFKTGIDRYSPFEQTLYIDADTEVHADLTRGFEFLKRCDIAMRPEGSPMSKTAREQNPAEAAELIRSMGEFNCGLMFFSNNERVHRLFAAWQVWQVRSKIHRDQRNFLRALQEVENLSIWPLPPAWNYLRNDFRSFSWERQIHRPFVWHYINFGFSPRAYYGCLKIAKTYGIPDTELRRLSFRWRFFMKPLISRWLRGLLGWKPWLLREFPPLD